jgi:HEAT repeat protein
MGRIGTDKAVAVLIDALSSSSRHTRRGALRGMCEVKDPRTIPHLLRRLDDEDGKVRRLAADALASIGEAAILPVRQALEEARERGGRRQHQLRGILQKLGGLPE